MSEQKFAYEVILGLMIVASGIFAVAQFREVRRLNRQNSVTLLYRLDQAMRWGICSVIAILAELVIIEMRYFFIILFPY